MTSKKSTQRHFPYQCQTKANTVKRGKSIERNFYIDFTSKQPIDQSSISDVSIKDSVINENITNENRYINTANKTMGDDLDIRYRNFRKDRLNYKNYLMSTDSSLTSSLYSPAISTSASSRSSSVKNNPQIPSLPEKVSSQKKRNSKKIENNRTSSKYQRSSSRNSRKTRKREVYLSENYYDSEYDNSLDYLISDYDDYEYSDYDSYSEIPMNNNNKKGKIRFVNGNSNLYNISEISELNNQSEIRSHKSQHRHRHKQSKQKVNLAQTQTTNKQAQLRPSQKSINAPQKQNKTIFQPKFCMTEDLTESFFDDLTDHPRKADEEEECNEKIKRLLNDITSEIDRVQKKSRLQLKISNSIHIFVNNPTIQRIKGRIPSSDVYMHVPRFESDVSSVSQMSYDDNDLTISAISFNNYGSPSPIKIKGNQTDKVNHQIKRIDVPNTDSEEINNSIDSANKEYIKKIKSRNINYQQILNNQNQNEKQKLIMKRNRNPSSSKEQSTQPANEAKINPNRLTINSNNVKNQNNSNKKVSNESNQKPQNFNPNQTKKMIQSLFSNQDNDEASKLTANESDPILQISRASPISKSNTNIVKNDQNKKYPMNASVQSFIQQNDQIIDDLQEPKSPKLSSLEAINLIPSLTSSLLMNNSNQKDIEAKDTNKQNSDMEISNGKTLSNISTINKVSNIASEQNEDQISNTNDLLSDSYDDTMSAGQKPNPNSASNINNNRNQSQNKISQDILFDEETTYNTTMSSFIDQSNIADEIILSEIRGYFDESSSRGETHKVIKPNDDTNNATNNNNKEEADNKSFSSLNNDDFLED